VTLLDPRIRHPANPWGTLEALVGLTSSACTHAPGFPRHLPFRGHDSPADGRGLRHVDAHAGLEGGRGVLGSGPPIFVLRNQRAETVAAVLRPLSPGTVPDPSGPPGRSRLCNFTPGSLGRERLYGGSDTPGPSESDRHGRALPSQPARKGAGREAARNRSRCSLGPAAMGEKVRPSGPLGNASRPACKEFASGGKPPTRVRFLPLDAVVAASVVA